MMPGIYGLDFKEIAAVRETDVSILIRLKNGEKMRLVKKILGKSQVAWFKEWLLINRDFAKFEATKKRKKSKR